jgi:hypothetical protein
MEGRNLRSRRRRGGTIAPVPMPELVGEIKGVGELAGGMCETPCRERRARLLRRRSQTRANVISRISARAEQIAVAALPCPVMPLPDVVDAPAAGVPVAPGATARDSDVATDGFGVADVVVITVDVEPMGVGRCVCAVVCETCPTVAEQMPGVLTSVLHLKFAGGGPGSIIEWNPMLAKRVSTGRPGRERKGARTAHFWQVLMIKSTVASTALSP